MIKKDNPVGWWFVYKFNAASYPACIVGAQRSCAFGGELKDYRGQFSQQFVYASSEDPSLKNGTDCLGNSDTDPVGATFNQIYNGSYYFVLWNDQFYGDPKIPGCNSNCSSPWASSKGILAWNDAGEGIVMQVTTPSWPAAGSRRFARKTDGNTLGCMQVNNLKNSQHFFSLKLSKPDILKLLNAMSNASVATDLHNQQLVKNGGPADIQESVQRLGTKSASAAYTDDTLSSGVRVISKPSNLHVPPWQMVSAILGGVSLRVATWWANPKIYTSPASLTDVTCWDKSLGKPGVVEIATSGYWAGQEFGLTGGAGIDFNHAKIGVSINSTRDYAIFGDLNQQGSLSERCSASQNGRGGLFFVVENHKLAIGLRNLINGETAFAQLRSEDGPRIVSGDSKTNAGELLLNFEGPVPDALLTSAAINLNGKEFKIVRPAPESKTLRLLGREKGPSAGLNIIRTATQAFTYWYEGTVLQSFADPYPTSYAIIAAIDDYARERDSLKRGPTGYPALTNMVEKAEALRNVLVGLDFPNDHIRTFYNENATREKLDKAFADFWEGGPFAGASRVFFYFGGHGDGAKGGGYLVTYDFDSKRPTATGFLMSDFLGRHFPFVRAKHLMVAIDSCSSGLAVGPPTLGSESKVTDFKTLALIRAAVEDTARDIIVAGTGTEPAVADAGGIFTQALIKGLQGEADLSKDGVINFDELSFYVRKEVIAQATMMGVHQEPTAFKATGFGHGEVVFILPQQK